VAHYLPEGLANMWDTKVTAWLTKTTAQRLLSYQTWHYDVVPVVTGDEDNAVAAALLSDWHRCDPLPAAVSHTPAVTASSLIATSLPETHTPCHSQSRVSLCADMSTVPQCAQKQICKRVSLSLSSQTNLSCITWHSANIVDRCIHMIMVQ